MAVKAFSKPNFVAITIFRAKMALFKCVRSALWVQLRHWLDILWPKLFA